MTCESRFFSRASLAPGSSIPNARTVNAMHAVRMNGNSQLVARSTPVPLALLRVLMVLSSESLAAPSDVTSTSPAAAAEDVAAPEGLALRRLMTAVAAAFFSFFVAGALHGHRGDNIPAQSMSGE